MELAVEMAEAMIHKINKSILLLEERWVSNGVVDELLSLKGMIEVLLGKLLDVDIPESCFGSSSTSSGSSSALSDSSSTSSGSSGGCRIQDVRRCLYDVDELVDDIFTAAKQRKIERHFPFSFIKQRKIAEKVKVMRKKFPSSTTAVEIKNIPGVQPCSKVSGDDGFGRNDDKNAITAMLFPSTGAATGAADREEEVSVISIFGVPGSGKTTLAKFVFDDDKVITHFERIWVWIGSELKPSSMIEKVGKALKDKVASSAANQRKKYLLVLDDMRTSEHTILDQLKNKLVSSGAPGYKVIVTTRSEQIAATIGTVTPYKLGAFSTDVAHKLLIKVASELEGYEQELLDIQREILRKSGNLPGTIQVLGSLLRDNVRSRLMALLNIDFSLLKEAYLLPIPERTYRLLRSPLKRCFAYCALFPGEFDMDKQQLVHLWIAQGFIKQPQDDDRHCIEDAAEECFTELEIWGFFKEVKGGQGTISSLNMQDAAFKLADEAAAGGARMVDLSNSSTAGNHPLSDDDGVYHLSIDGPPGSLTEEVISSLPVQLRSFLKLSGSRVQLNQNFAKLITRFSHLRALDLHLSGIDSVPSNLGSLKHLRYLNLSNNPFASLPDSTDMLANLQVLDLSYCGELKQLPRHLRKLISLRHLYLEGCKSLTGMPIGLGQMTNLQTLSHFFLGKGNKFCQLDELGKLNLKAELTIVFATQQ